MTFKDLVSTPQRKMLLIAAVAAVFAMVFELNAFNATRVYGNQRHSGTSGGACGFAILSGLALVCYTWLTIGEKRGGTEKETANHTPPVTRPEGDKDELAGP